MADFQSQAMGLTGLTIDASSTDPSRAEFSTFLNDGVIDVTVKWLAGYPQDRDDFTRESSETTSNASLDLGGASIVAVVREDGATSDNWRPCRKISPAQQYLVTDTESLSFASKTNPVYMIGDNGKISIFPSPGADPNAFKVYYVNNSPEETDGTALDHASTGIKYFPSDKIYLVVLYASIKSLSAKMTKIINDLGTFSVSTVIADNLAVPSFTYSAASDDTSIDSEVGAITDLEALSSRPNYASPTTTISGVAWATEYPAQATAITSALALVKDAADQAALAGSNFERLDDSSVFGDEETFLTDKSQLTLVKNALDRVKAYISGDEPSSTTDAYGAQSVQDTELAQSALNIAQAEMNRAQAHLQEWVAIGDMRAKQINAALNEAQGYVGEIAVRLSATPIKVSEYSARMQDSLNEFNEAVVKYQAEIQEHLQESQNEVTRLTTIYNKSTDVNVQNAVNNYRLFVDEYAAKLQKYQAEVQAYAAEVNADITEQTAKVQTESAKYQWLQERATALQVEYRTALAAPQPEGVRR